MRKNLYELSYKERLYWLEKSVKLLKKLARSGALKGFDDSQDYKVCSFLCHLTGEKEFDSYSGTEKFLNKPIKGINV